jgi:2-(1,2-epoxy-1,2-dihydrophenyl)acetyl-CoA isomerase
VSDELLYSLDKGVGWITLNRPDAHNAITPDQRNELIALLEDCSADTDVRCIVLTATGKGFCTGADLRAGGRTAGEEPRERTVGDVARMIRTGAQRLVAAVLDCEKPVIAAVNGTAAGLGAHLALAADLVIAADSARFIEVFIRRGIAVDAGGAYLLPRIVGLHKAKELVFFGDDLSAADAERLGLVNKVVPLDQLESAAREWAERLAKAPTKAIAMDKWLLNRSLDSDRRTAFDEEAWAQELLQNTADAQEGMAAFRDRREPDYKGV